SRYAPVRARLVTKPYRRILKTSGYAGGYLFCAPINDFLLRSVNISLTLTLDKLNRFSCMLLNENIF
ncbi:hypothetical protein, partial [Providencia huaxiensis]